LENFPGWVDAKLSAKISISGQEIGLLGILNKDAEKNINLKIKSKLIQAKVEFRFFDMVYKLSYLLTEK